MRLLPVFLLLAVAAPAAEFAVARPGYRYEFPRDDYAHPEFKTEWWYYTGNLRTADGRRFGFELTFFRQALRPELAASTWEPRDVWLAHFALSDLEGRRYFHSERTNRSGPGLAGASLEQRLVWNGNWEAGPEHLRAVSGDFRVDLRLRRLKPPVIHGENGVSQKSPGEGKASHYISYTRIAAEGRIEVRGSEFEVEGTAWMDHEFFTHVLEPDQAGWDWFSIQLDNETELMLGRIRRRDGSDAGTFHGTFVERDGRTRFLKPGEFDLEPLRTWDSPATGARYPVEWRIRVPALDLNLELTTRLDNQELVGRGRQPLAYWEGAVEYRGALAGRAITGLGYLEMTGYAHPVNLSGDAPR
jgi:predicted secreted hydrolase